MTNILCVRFDCLFNNNCGDCKADRVMFSGTRLGDKRLECKTYINRDSERAEKAKQEAIEILHDSTSKDEVKRMKCPRCESNDTENISHHGEPDLFRCGDCYTAWWIEQFHPDFKLVKSYRGSASE